MTRGVKVQRNEVIARQVQNMAAFGITVDNMAKIVGLSKNTLKKLYNEEIELGKDKMVVNVANRLYQRAMGDGRDGVAAGIFLLKTQGKRHGFVERQEVEDVNETSGELDERINELFERARIRASNGKREKGTGVSSGKKAPRASKPKSS